MRKELLLSSVLPGAHGAITHSRSLPEAVPLSRFAVIHHTSVPAVELQLEELEPEIFLRDLALCLHMHPQQRKGCLKRESRSCAVASLKNDISSWSSDLSTGPERSTSCHHSLVFGQIVLLVWVKKNAFSRIHLLMRELEEASDYACSHLFLKVFFLFTVLSAIQKCCNSVDTFTRDHLALWVVSPFQALSS